MLLEYMVLVTEPNMGSSYCTVTNSGAMAPLEKKFGKTYMFYFRFAKRNEK